MIILILPIRVVYIYIYLVNISVNCLKLLKMFSYFAFHAHEKTYLKPLAVSLSYFNIFFRSSPERKSGA